MTSLSLITVYAAARRRARREDGVIALMTLAFMIVLGLVSIVTLWSIAYATGAYNQLYSTTQAAAYAAVGQTLPQQQGSGAQQLDFSCVDSNGTPRAAGDVVCGGGGVMAVVNATFRASMSGSGGFGLTFPGSVQLIDPVTQSPADYVDAYYVSEAPATAKASWLAEKSPPCPAYGASQGGAPSDTLVCWKINNAFSQVFTGEHFNSGVVVAAAANIRLPGCGICATYQLAVEVAATEAQTTSP